MSNKDMNATGRWLKKITQSLGEPQDRDDLVSMLRAAGERGVIDDDACTMLEGVLEVADLQVRDIMVPRGQMISVRRDDPRSEEHTSELQSLRHLVCRLLLEKKKNSKKE